MKLSFVFNKFKESIAGVTTNELSFPGNGMQESEI